MIEAGWDCHVHVFDAAAPVLAGHYQPPTRTLAEIEASAAAEGVGRLVLVQPSVYGHDHTLLLQALRAEPGRHRGVAVVDANVGDAELDTLHAAGVRGMRCNLVSPVGLRQDPAALMLRLAPRLRERGWHVQWYLHSHQLAPLVPLQAQTGLVFVLDHLAGCRAGMAVDHPAWAALAELAAAGAWIKLSAWYRLNAPAPFDSLHPQLQRAAALFKHHCVWGSDWPHTSLDASTELPYAATWWPVQRVLAADLALAIRTTNPLRLYA